LESLPAALRTLVCGSLAAFSQKVACKRLAALVIIATLAVAGNVRKRFQWLIQFCDSSRREKKSCDD